MTTVQIEYTISLAEDEWNDLNYQLNHPDEDTLSRSRDFFTSAVNSIRVTETATGYVVSSDNLDIEGILAALHNVSDSTEEFHYTIRKRYSSESTHPIGKIKFNNKAESGAFTTSLLISNTRKESYNYSEDVMPEVA